MSRSIPFLVELNRRLKYTPDFPLLKRRVVIPIFVFDEFKQDFQEGEKDPFFKNAEYYGSAHTTNSTFIMKNEKSILGNEPTVFETYRGEVGAKRILGEVYGVSVEHVAYLDRFYGNGHRTHRKYVQVALHHQVRTQGFMLCKAFMWLGDKEFFKYHRMDTSWVENYYSSNDVIMRTVSGYCHA